MCDKEKIALFDFCETIVNFQTADAYVKYIRDNYGCKSMWRKEKFRLFLIKYNILSLLGRVIKHSSLNKRLVLWQLKGYRQDLLEMYAQEYYQKVIKPNFISQVILELKKLKMEGWRIVIVSAGYEIYLRCFANDFHIAEGDVIAVKIKFKDGICKGTFDGGDRLWDKLEKLEQKFNRQFIHSIAYSDSMSDLPMLQWADEAVVVQRLDKIEWADKYGFRKVIWE